MNHFLIDGDSIPPQYVYREYPRHLHKHGGAYLEVTSDAERDAALADGWSLAPVPDGSPLPTPKRGRK